MKNIFQECILKVPSSFWALWNLSQGAHTQNHRNREEIWQNENYFYLTTFRKEFSIFIHYNTAFMLHLMIDALNTMKLEKLYALEIPQTVTAWKVSKYGVFSGPYFPVFSLNKEIYSVNLRIQSEYRKYGPEKNSVFVQFSRSVYLRMDLVWTILYNLFVTHFFP